MTKFSLLFVTILAAVIHLGLTADLSRAKEEKISFVDDGDDAIRERIRTEMDNYKRMKEMMLKAKKTTAKPAEMETSSATAESTTMTVVESSAAPITETPLTSSEAPKEVEPLASSETPVATPEVAVTSSEAPVTSSEAPVISPEAPPAKMPVAASTTLRPVFNPDLEEAEDAEEGPVPTEDETMPAGNKTVIDDRFIINAPAICKDGKKADHAGKCRKIVR